MCCFSVQPKTSLLGGLFAKKVHVSKTNIFARMTTPGVQALAYGMNLETSRAVAMVLPLPVRQGAGEDAVHFIDLHEHPRMFDELAELFVISAPLSRGYGPSPQSARPRLVVHQVGMFVASYVPTRRDFDRLDPQFRIPAVLFDAIPEYGSYGFAVFQLAPGKVTVHPMAFTFPTREPKRLFFPTVHLHDGTFSATAKFDHALYYQHPRCDQLGQRFGDDLSSYMKPETYGDLLEERPLLRRTLHARLPNQDTWIAAD
jgi:hypothetical protein